MSKIIFISGNAGQGKSVVSFNIASALKEFGFDVLLIDGDLKTSKLREFAGLPRKAHTIEDVLSKKVQIENAIYQKPSGLKILVSGNSEVHKHNILKIIQEAKDFAEVCIVDLPQSEINSSSGECILVTSPDLPSLMNAARLSNTGKVSGVIVNRTFGEKHELDESNIETFVQKRVIGSVSDDSIIRNALSKGCSVVELYPDYEVSAKIKEIAAKLMNVEYIGKGKRVPILARLGIFA